MKKKSLIFILFVTALVACNKPSKVEQYLADKHVRDSVGLCDQTRSLAYFQSQLDSLMPVSDSLISLFKYEKNDKYQDNGNYVLTGSDGLRILVHDDGKEILLYRYGKRVQPSDIKLTNKDQVSLERAQHLQIVIHDIRELEKRIAHTSLEVQKYQKRLENEKTEK